jgi:TolB-like protein
MPGKTIGRYEILAELGRGANGVVWKARHTLLPDRLVALKVLSDSLWSSAEARHRFLQEAIAVSRLDHPGIATLHDAEEVEGQLYIAFKLVDGETAGQATAQGPMPLRRAVSVARDAAEALAHAHARGVVHRDLSAGNVMVDREGRGVLVDFGLARAGDQSATATAGLVVGTLAYMAPEVLRGEGADARSDLYGLGAVLYRMLTGRAPFEGRQAEEVAYQVLHRRPAPPSTLNPAIPPELDEIVLRALERDARDRYASANEMSGALGGVLEGMPLAEGGTLAASVVGRLLSGIRRALRRRSARWVVAFGAVAVAALVGLGIAWLRGWRPGFATRVPVVGVLPTRNLSEDPQETSYLSGAFGEDLVTRLGQVSNLRLLPWITTQRFTDPKQELKAVGRELQADKLVVGSYRSDGERVRVTVALVDARTGLQSWTQAYEESAEDLFALQQEVASGVASQLRGSLTAAERERLGAAASRSPEAYEFYLRGADFMNSQDPQTIALAGRYFDKALELDPKLAQAWVGVGAVKTDLYHRGQVGNSDLDAAERAFHRALSLNPNLYSAVRGLIRVSYEQGQFERILTIGKSLGRRGDDAEALLARGSAYFLGGLAEKAVPLFDRVLKLDPGNQGAAWHRAVAESWAGQPTLAAEHAKAYIRKFGEDPEIYTWLAVSLYTLGERPQARLFLERSLRLFGEDQSNLYSSVYAYNFYRAIGERARADSLALYWFDVFDTRFQANPDNVRVRAYRAALAAGLGLPEGGHMLDSVLIDAQNPASGVFGLSEIFGASWDLPRFRRACLALQKGDLAIDYPTVRSGLLHLTFGSQYSSVEQVPEFRALLAAMKRRHDELAGKY